MINEYVVMSRLRGTKICAFAVIAGLRAMDQWMSRYSAIEGKVING
jgi:hypothetical protein